MKNTFLKTPNPEKNAAEAVDEPIYIWQNRTLLRIDPDNITMICSERNYCKIFMKNERTYLVRCTLSDIMKQLPANVFVRTNRTFAVSLKHINTIEKDELMIGDNYIPISRLKYDQVIEQLKIVGR